MVFVPVIFSPTLACSNQSLRRAKKIEARKLTLRTALQLSDLIKMSLTRGSHSARPPFYFLETNAVMSPGVRTQVLHRTKPSEIVRIINVRRQRQ